MRIRYRVVSFRRAALALALALPLVAGGQAQAPPTAPGAAEPPLAAPGDPRLGKDLFRGVAHLRNGGPPCLACHGASGVAVLGGGTLGPDLAAAFPKYTAGLPTVLAQMPFPTMRPLFAGRDLTPEEVRDLTAFLTEIALSGPEPTTPRLLVVTALGFVALLVFIFLAWQNRLAGVRRGLTRGARRGKGGAG